MKKILCPIDFSEVSLNALEFASAIGEKENSIITLLNVFTPGDFDKILEKEHVQEEYNKLLEIAEAKLKALTEEISLMAKDGGLSACNYLLKSGEVIDVVQELIKEEHYEMIVMGTTGHSSYDKQYLGGQAEKIIHEASCSLICIPQNQVFHGIKNIVYATDYQEEDKIAIQQVASLATLLNAQITILHISHHNDAIDKAMYDEFKNELGSFVSYRKLVYDRVVFDHVADGLNQYMNQNDGDLLVLLKKKLNFFESMFHRSLTDHLDRIADYPIMILKL